MRSLRRQFGVFGRAPSFRLLVLATLGSSLGTLLATVALIIDVKDRTDSGTWVSALLIVDFLPVIAIGLLLGPLLDRLPRRTLMVAADLVRAAVFCALPFATSALQIVLLVAIVGFAGGFFRPAAYAGLPNMVGAKDLPAANALLQGVENVSWTVGPVLGGLLTEIGGPDPVYWINAASFLLSAALIAAIPRRLLQAAAAATRGHWGDVADGLRLVVQRRPLLTVLVAWTLGMAGLAAVNTGEVFLAKDVFDAGDFGYGLLFSSIGLGLALGSVIGGVWVERRKMSIVYGGGLTLLALAIGAVAVAPNVWVAAVFCIAVGIGNGIAVVCNALFVQRGAPDELRGRAFTVIMALNYVVFGLAMVASGLLVDRVGPRWVWGGAAVVIGAAAVIGAGLGSGVVEEAPLEAGEAEPSLQRAV